MPYELADHVSCCDVDDRTVFLDVARDRYFLLPPALEAAFRALQSGGRPPERYRLSLVASGLLVEASRATHASESLPLPTRSVLEQAEASADARPSLAAVTEVLVCVCLMRLRLRTERLQKILARASGRDSRAVPPLIADADVSAQDRLATASAQFMLARRYVPIERTCLLDSLSLVRFLARRQLRAALVFGVTLHPFAAHCWVQAGDLLLNETLSDANTYTPIRVIG
ncbi:lasso peptide biosynthesis B2 protein [Luteimonas saliphila]|uniref:lasso peptide biosynthesis B2 protein n=1 Tax=Luteimonas saliphila TaxID=2804919 RepID=UPI00192D74AF|nr:lasso peptide biosynthesis B2 protein [Luteimonas saliphila]